MAQLSSLLKYVDVLDSGAVLLGRVYEVDGFGKRLVRVITHAHYDHIVGLNESIIHASAIVATQATIDLLLELGYVRGKYRTIFKNKAVPLPYNRDVEFMNERIRLVPSRHIIGACQVLVETNNYRIGYTGDFKLGDGTEIMSDLDVLVIESTYGDPRYRRPFKDDIEELFVDQVLDLLRKGPVIIYGYHGKLQEAMRILRKYGITEPFIMPERIYRVTRIAEKHGYNIGEYYSLRTNKGYMIKNSGRYIMFQHMSRAKYRRLNGEQYHIILSGWEFNDPIKKLDPYSWLVALSDHADFDELVEYVEQAKPRLVVVEAGRQGEPYKLAAELRRKGFRTIVLPGPRVVDEMFE